MQTIRPSAAAALLWILCGLCQTAVSADWPAYRSDAGRSGYTPEPLPRELALLWVYRATHPPEPAWPRSPRMPYDRALHPVVADGLLFFGSSADSKIYALDAATGSERWSFITGSPVRFAPAFSKGRLFAGSDDGHLYCLNAPNGDLLWKKRAGPDDRWVLGNGRLVSRWPARGGPVVYGDTVYFAAGIWPSDGIYVYALDPESGATRWLNDSAGFLYMGQPHGGAYAESGVSAQGYMVVTEDHLLLPTGRAVPGVFKREDGSFEYFHLQKNGQTGGCEVLVSDRFFLNGGTVFEISTGAAQGKVGAGALAARPGGIVRATATALTAHRWTDKVRMDRKGGREAYRGLEEVFRLDQKGLDATVIVAGDRVVSGGRGRVAAVDLTTLKRIWSAEVDGTAHGLAAANRRLYVSTDEGLIYCFAAPANSRAGIEPVEIEPRLDASPYDPDDTYAAAAQEIIERSRFKEGYCVDLGAGDGRLAYELARRTNLFICAVESDPDAVALARRKLDAAGLCGSRVTVIQDDPKKTPLPVYFADLVVSGHAVTRGASVVSLQEACRLQRPYGGVLCVGRPGAMKLAVRGPLKGAGAWTHQYADPANTSCSGDRLIEGPLGMLWFTDVGQRMTQRHGRAPSPLLNNGVIFSEGVDNLVAVNAYNGRKLWEYSLPGILEAYDGDHLMGTSGSGSNYCVSDDSVYVRRDDYCLRIDATNGTLLGNFLAPEGSGSERPVWGFIACDRRVLFGSFANTEHVVTYRYLRGGDLKKQLTESTTLFALDAATGKLRWRYDAKQSIRHNAIAIGLGTVVLIDRPLALYDRSREGKPPKDETPGELIALDATTGEARWSNRHGIYGTLVALSPEHEIVLVGYQPTRFRLASEIGGRIACFRLRSGARIWERNVRYASRPIINDRTIYAEGGAWDLLTGEERPFRFKRSYGCGILAASKNLLVFRSATLGYFDLRGNGKTEDFGGVRPGCWINALPAGGLILAPDASAGCVCSYQNRAWVALQHDGVRYRERKK